jgi:hypothetical protein
MNTRRVIMRLTEKAMNVPYAAWEVGSNYEGSVDASFNALLQRDSRVEGVFKMLLVSNIRFPRVICKFGKEKRRLKIVNVQRDFRVFPESTANGK